MEDYVTKTFGNNLRVRVCGVLVNDEGILLVKHKGVGKTGTMWLPPGGGMIFGSSIKDNLRREFHEETGLKVKIKEFIGITEFLEPPLHAVEVFFNVEKKSGNLIKGIDPELTSDLQIIEDVRFVTFDELRVIPSNEKHRILQNVLNADDLKKNCQSIE